MTGELTNVAMGRLIREALAEDGIPQAEFARRVGASLKHVNQVVNGKATASVGQLDYWAFVLGRQWCITLERREVYTS